MERSKNGSLFVCYFFETTFEVAVRFEISLMNLCRWND